MKICLRNLAFYLGIAYIGLHQVKSTPSDSRRSYAAKATNTDGSKNQQEQNVQISKTFKSKQELVNYDVSKNKESIRRHKANVFDQLNVFRRLKKPNSFKSCPHIGTTARRSLWIAVFLPFPDNWSTLWGSSISSIQTTPHHSTQLETVWRALFSAQDYVNNDSRLLAGSQLCLEAVDTPCSTSRGIQSFFEQMRRRPTTLAVVGPSCFQTASTLAQTIQFWKVPQVSFNLNELELANQRVFPTFVRTLPGMRAQLDAMATLLLRYNWTVVDIFQSDDARSIANHHQLLSIAGSRGIEVSCEFVFARNRFDPRLVDIINKTHNNIKIFLGDGKEARRFFCQVYRFEWVSTENHVWLLTGNFENEWWTIDDVNCTSLEMTQAVMGHFLIDQRVDQRDDLSGRVLQDSATNQRRSTWNESIVSWAYDSILSISDALQIAQKDYSANRSLEFQPAVVDDGFREFFLRSFDKVNIFGKSGAIRFQEGERQGRLTVRQFRKNGYVVVGHYDMVTSSLQINEGNITWPGGKVPPRATALTLFRINFFSLYIMGLVAALSLGGILLALVFLAFNIKNRAVRIVKMSSPNLNNVIAGGCVTAYVSLILLGIETNLVSERSFDILCKIRHWLPTCAFTLAFGTMFLKTWRVHAIFTNVTVKRKVIKDYKLFAILGIFLSLDFITLTTWHIVDPMRRVVENVTGEIWVSQGSYLVVYQEEFCQSNYAFAWLAVICIYKGIILVFGLFLAWETRHVALSPLNDSKYIGVSVYVTVIACVIGPTTSFALRDYLNLSFAVQAFSIFLCTTATLCLVFVPKVTALRRLGDSPNQLMNIRLQALRKRKSTPQPVRSILSMTIRGGPGLPRGLSEAVNTFTDDKQSSSSTKENNQLAANARNSVRSLSETLKTERRRLEKILEEKTAECRRGQHGLSATNSMSHSDKPEKESTAIM